MEIEELRGLMEKYAKQKGYKLNPNREVVDAILRGLLQNERRYGYRYCPCRPVLGDRQADLPKICPCRWHADEIRKMGRCHCGLFMRGNTVREHEQKIESIQLAKENQSASEIVVLSNSTFERFLREHSAAVVDFWAEWCTPCKMLAPIVEKLAKRYAGKVTFGKLNVDENPEIAARFEVNAIPALLFFKDGELIDRVVGVTSQSTLESKIAKLL